MVVLTDEPVQKPGQVPKRENRSRINIIADFLDICERDGPIKKTRLMQSVNLSSSMITEYLEYMVEKYLILKKEGGYYAITQRGKSTTLVSTNNRASNRREGTDSSEQDRQSITCCY